MSYFNKEQCEYMDSLSRIPPEQLCWCGWCRKGGCTTAYRCPPDKSLADRRAVECRECGSYPDLFGAGEIVHRGGCTAASKRDGAT